MNEKEFNLLDEPWIKVLDIGMIEREISIKEVLLNADHYRGLSGEMETQNAAILRLLLAIVITIFYRYDVEGVYDPIDDDWDKEDVLGRWKEVWNRGCFPRKAVEQYLEDHREAFWLFHSERPFYQIPELKYGTEFKSAKNLFGDLKESNNSATKHHFSMREGIELDRLAYPEAARWLIHLISYSVNLKWDSNADGAKCKSSIGWMGQLGLLEVSGVNLFETLMLNAVLLKDGEDIWGFPNPTWERKSVHISQGEYDAPPDNLPALYTLPSRRIMLYRQDGYVVGYRSMLGEYFNAENYFSEQMTIWKMQEDKATKEKSYLPKVHREEIQAWREFPAIFDWKRAIRVPGLICWLRELLYAGYIEEERFLHLRTIAQYYDGMRYQYTGYTADMIALSFDLLNAKGDVWRELISIEIEKCKHTADEIGKFSDWITNYIYGEKYKGKESLRIRCQTSYYSEIDTRFRSWLENIQADDQNKDEKLHEWHRISFIAASDIAEERINELHLDIFDQRKSNDTPAGKFVKFTGALAGIYPDCLTKKKGEKDE